MTTKDRIKEELRKGGLVFAKRRTGKTTAILELAHEFGSSNCALGVNTALQASLLSLDWKKLFPQDEPLRIEHLSTVTRFAVGRRAQFKLFDEWTGSLAGLANLEVHAATATDPGIRIVQIEGDD